MHTRFPSITDLIDAEIVSRTLATTSSCSLISIPFILHLFFSVKELQYGVQEPVGLDPR